MIQNNYKRFRKDGKTCVNCGEKLKTNRTKFCSGICYTKFRLKNYRTINPYSGLPTATIGSISELRVSIDLMGKGYHVFRAHSPSCPCDLVAFKEDGVLMIEVRTAHINSNGTIVKVISKRDNPKIINHYAWVTQNSIIYDPEIHF